MSDDSRRTRGTVAKPPDVAEQRSERTRREKAAVADLETRLRGGDVTPEQADEAILELALERLWYLPPETIDALRDLGREIFDEPEMIESRRFAPRPPGRGDDEP